MKTLDGIFKMKKCICICHDDPLKKDNGYEHDIKCCSKMNGYIKEKWEVRFDENFGGLISKSRQGEMTLAEWNKLKSFISNLLKAQRAEILSKLPIKENVGCDKKTAIWCGGYNTKNGELMIWRDKQLREGK